MIPYGKAGKSAMNEFLILAFLFFIGCVAGWCLEVLYRRFAPANTSRKWINPGFLNGPWLPLYGFGLCCLYLMAGLEGSAVMRHVTVGSKLVLFVIMALVMTLLEYVAGLIFIKGMNIKLWDYSNEKFNIQGIICLKFSFYWALLGAFYYFVIHPRVLEALIWFAQNLAFSFVVGMFYGVFLVDLTASLGIVARVRRFAIDNQIQIRYEELKQEIRENAEARAADRQEKLARLRFLLPFKSEVPLGEHLRKYGELHDAFGVTPQEFFDELQDKVADKVDAAKDSLLEALQDTDLGGKVTKK